MENEIWAPVDGYNGFYEISNLGRVRSLKRTIKIGNIYRTVPEKMIFLSKNELGYVVVCLCREGKMKTKRVARLVGIAFIPNPDNLPEINHKRGIKEDNRATELEWSSISDNRKHAWRLGLNKGNTRKVF